MLLEVGRAFESIEVKFPAHVCVVQITSHDKYKLCLNKLEPPFGELMGWFGRRQRLVTTD